MDRPWTRVFGELFFNAQLFLFISIFVLSGCYNKDFEEITDWEDDHPTVLASGADSYEESNVREFEPFLPSRFEQTFENRLLLATVTVLNFQFEKLVEWGESSSLSQKIIRDTFAQMSPMLREETLEKMGCGDFDQSRMVEIRCVEESVIESLRLHQYDHYSSLMKIYPRIDDLLLSGYSSGLDKALRFNQIRKALSEDRKSLGSGFFVELNDELYVISNDHVINRDFEALHEKGDSEALKFTILYHDRSQVDLRHAPKSRATVELVSRDPYFDISLLKVENQSIKRNVMTLELANDQDESVGAPVVAVGSPHGLTSTYTKGFISNSKRYFDGIFSYTIQHTALIGPGNSGGPLLNVEGDVIGLNTFKVFENYFLAIPSSVIQSTLIERLKNKVRTYFEPSIEFKKVPYTVQHELLDLYFDEEVKPSLEERALFFASEFNSQPRGAKDGIFKPAVEMGTLIDRYRVDGQEKALVSPQQMLMDIAYSKEGWVEVFALDRKGDGTEGDWVMIPNSRYQESDRRSFVAEVLRNIYARVDDANRALIERIQEQLSNEENEKEIKYFKLANGKFVEFEEEGMNKVFYLGNGGEVWSVESLNFIPVRSIRRIREIVGSYLGRFEGEEKLPPFTLEYRDYRKGITTYKKYFLRKHLEGESISFGEREAAYEQVLQSLGRDRRLTIVKISKSNLEKLVTLFDEAIQVGEKQIPERNEERAFKLVLPWAYASLYTLFSYYNGDNQLDGTLDENTKLSTVWRDYDWSFAYSKKSNLGNCFKNESFSADFGLGYNVDHHRICFSDTSLFKDSHGNLLPKDDTTYLVLENRLPSIENEVPDFEKYNLEHPSYQAFRTVSETEVERFVESAITYDLAKDDLPREIRNMFLQYGGVESFSWTTIAPQNILRRSISKQKVVGVVSDDINFSSPTSEGAPYFDQSRLNQMISWGLEGEIFDLRTDEKGEFPKDLNFHIFVPNRNFYVDSSEIATKGEWLRKNFGKMLNSRFVKYQFNPELLLTVFDLNLDVFKNEGCCTEKTLRPDAARLVVFQKKNGGTNDINYKFFLAVKVVASNLVIFGGENNEGHYLSTLPILEFVNGPSVTWREKRRNEMTRWVLHSLP